MALQATMRSLYMHILRKKNPKQDDMLSSRVIAVCDVFGDSVRR